jgi:hypothetical protein
LQLPVKYVNFERSIPVNVKKPPMPLQKKQRFPRAIHHIHDRYFRFVLHVRSIARDLLQLGVPRDVLNLIELQDMELTSDSFVDRQLKAYFTDVCYTTRTTDGNDLKVTIHDWKMSD